MSKRLMIVGIVFAVLIIAYVVFFSKGASISYLVKHRLVGRTTKHMLQSLDAKFLGAWRKAHESGLQWFTYSNGINYRTTFPINGVITSSEYGRSS